MLRILIVEDDDTNDTTVANMQFFLPGMRVDSPNITFAKTMAEGIRHISEMPTDGRRQQGYFDLIVLDRQLLAVDTTDTDREYLTTLAKEAEAAGVAAWSALAPKHVDGGLWLWALVERRFKRCDMKPAVILFSHFDFENWFPILRFADSLEYFSKRHRVTQTTSRVSNQSEEALTRLRQMASRFSNISDQDQFNAQLNELSRVLSPSESNQSASPQDVSIGETDVDAFRRKLDKHRSYWLGRLEISPVLDSALGVKGMPSGVLQEKRNALKRLGETNLADESNICYPLATYFPDVDFSVQNADEIDAQIGRLAQGLRGRPQPVVLYELLKVDHVVKAATHVNQMIEANYMEAIDHVKACTELRTETSTSLVSSLLNISIAVNNKAIAVDCQAILDTHWVGRFRSTVLKVNCSHEMLLTLEQYVDVAEAEHCIQTAYAAMKEYYDKLANSTWNVDVSTPNRVQFKVLCEGKVLSEKGWTVNGFVAEITGRLGPAAGASLYQLSRQCRGYFDAVFEMSDGTNAEAIELVTAGKTTPRMDKLEVGYKLTLDFKAHKNL